MQCPDCNVPMDREDYYFSMSVGYAQRGFESSHRPQAEYSCPDCGATFFWERGSALRPVYDPREDKTDPALLRATMPDAPPLFADNLEPAYGWGVRFPSEGHRAEPSEVRIVRPGRKKES